MALNTAKLIVKDFTPVSFKTHLKDSQMVLKSQVLIEVLRPKHFSSVIRDLIKFCDTPGEKLLNPNYGKNDIDS